ncbi:glycosyltransferase, partial [Rathayibacter sp. VKM Ac-2754]|nr:hypothetical protein [Rathayibacter sp. VKM Ac-2754]
MSAVRGHRTPALAPSGAPALVSVVIAVEEHDDRLPRALASVLAQTGVRLDVVVVTAWSLAVTDPRVRVVPSRAGALEARNLGLALASGDAVMVLPVTDVLTEGALERAAALLAAHPWIGAVYGAAEISDATAPEARGRVDWTLWSGSDWIERTSRHGSDLVLDHAALVRRSVADALGGYAVDLPRTADLDYWLRLAAVSGVGRINGVAQTLCRPLPAADPLAELRERHDALERFFESAGHDWSGRTARGGDRRE